MISENWSLISYFCVADLSVSFLQTFNKYLSAGELPDLWVREGWSKYIFIVYIGLFNMEVVKNITPGGNKARGQQTVGKCCIIVFDHALDLAIIMSIILNGFCRGFTVHNSSPCYGNDAGATFYRLHLYFSSTVAMRKGVIYIKTKEKWKYPWRGHLTTMTTVQWVIIAQMSPGC